MSKRQVFLTEGSNIVAANGHGNASKTRI
uniref:Uncharacterized protein n=1 Tax=Arundo donax TaxID=35708 RepID=A0A0A9TPJ0_ARUDO